MLYEQGVFPNIPCWTLFIDKPTQKDCLLRIRRRQLCVNLKTLGYFFSYLEVAGYLIFVFQLLLSGVENRGPNFVLVEISIKES